MGISPNNAAAEMVPPSAGWREWERGWERREKRGKFKYLRPQYSAGLPTVIAVYYGASYARLSLPCSRW